MGPAEPLTNGIGAGDSGAAGGPLQKESMSRVARNYNSRTTGYIVFVVLLSATAGLLLGYDNGVMGGVLAMDDFEEKFFPENHACSLDPKCSASTSAYCKHNDQVQSLVISSLYLSAIVACFASETISHRYGRRVVMAVSGVFFIVGAICQAASENVAALIFGRLLLGVGVGGGSTVAPVYLTEMAPQQLRGTLTVLFQLFITVGILVAALINYGAQYIHPWGWRLSVACAGAPGILILLAGLVLPDSPSSYCERGRPEKALQVLRKIRGTDDVALEMDDIAAAAETARMVKRPFLDFITKRRYRPQFIISSIFMFFQQLDGINAIIFYAPVLFQAINGKDKALLTYVIVALVNVVATFIVIAVVDRWGRRRTLMLGAFHMFTTQIVVAGLLGYYLARVSSAANLPEPVATAVLVFICLFVSGHAWSWGPLGFLVPVEVQPLETRAAGSALNVAVNMLFTFWIGQAFPAMLCGMRFGVFLFFAGWLIIMGVCVYFFLPETKGVGVENVHFLFDAHWYWRRYSELLPSSRNGRSDTELAGHQPNPKLQGGATRPHGAPPPGGPYEGMAGPEMGPSATAPSPKEW